VRFLRRLGLYFLIAYSVWFLASCGLQERLIYPRYLAGPALPDAAVPPEVERLWITTEGDGARTEAWFVPAPGSSAANPAPVAIFFHGNAEFIDHNLSLVERYNARGYSVLMPEFRGYGRSGGSPNQANIVADADAFYGLLTKRRDIDASRIVIHGRSLGTGVAAQLAALHEPKALILESPFTSIARFAWHYGVPPIFLRSPFRTDRVLPNLSCPVLILAGRSDEVIPIHHGQELQRLAKNGTMVELDGSHNSGLSEQGAYWTAIDSVLTKLK
jgi:pimeloyl-ACP methyl ester carboxylesterase